MTGFESISKTTSGTEAVQEYFFNDGYETLQSSYEAGFSNEDAEVVAQLYLNNERMTREQVPNLRNNHTDTRTHQNQRVAFPSSNNSHTTDPGKNGSSTSDTSLSLRDQRFMGQQALNRQNLHTDTTFHRTRQVADQPHITQYHSIQHNNNFSNEGTDLDGGYQRSVQQQVLDRQAYPTSTDSYRSRQVTTYPQHIPGPTGQFNNAFSTCNTSSTVLRSTEAHDYPQHTFDFTDPRRPSSPLNVYGYEQPPSNIYESLPRSSLSGGSRNNSGSSEYLDEEHTASVSYSDLSWVPVETILPTPTQSTLQQPSLPAQVPRQPVYRPSAPSADRFARYSHTITSMRQEQDRRRATALANPPRSSLPTITTTMPPPPPQQPATTAAAAATTTNPSNLAQLHHSSLATTYAGRRSAEARQNFPFACSACDKKYLYLNSAQKHWRMHHASVSATPNIVERWAGAPSRPTPAIPRNAQAVQARGRQARRGGFGVGGTKSVGGGSGGMGGQRALPALDSGSKSDSNGLVASFPPVTLAAVPTFQPFPPREVIDDGNQSLTWVAAVGRWYRFAGVGGDREWWDHGMRMWRRG